MADDWTQKFKKKFEEKELAAQRAVKSFQVYQDQTLKLFNEIEAKVKDIDIITTQRLSVDYSGNAPAAIKALHLKCNQEVVRFIPEGINQDEGRGRIRIKHNTSNLSPYIYLHLVVDETSREMYPDNLTWTINPTGDSKAIFTALPKFDEKQIELLLEKCFL